MRTGQLIALLILVFWGNGLVGCGKTSDQESTEKKAKELNSGTIKLSKPKKW